MRDQKSAKLGRKEELAPRAEQQDHVAQPRHRQPGRDEPEERPATVPGIDIEIEQQGRKQHRLEDVFQPSDVEQLSHQVA
jgi:hypothetical protein